MDGGDSKKEGGDPKPPSELVPAAKESLPALAAEVIDGARVDPNTIVVQVVQRAEPKDIVPVLKEVGALVKSLDEAEIDTFRKRVDAVIDAKTRDPDELEKRDEARSPRYIRTGMALIMAPSLLIGAVIAMVRNAPMPVISLLIGTSCVLMVLLTAASVAPTIGIRDVLRLIQSTRQLNRPPDPPDGGDETDRGGRSTNGRAAKSNARTKGGRRR